MGFTLVELVRLLEKTQWKYVPPKPPSGPVLTRRDLQSMQTEGPFVSRTSGSTGEPVTVRKGEATALWWHATNIRNMQWRKYTFEDTTRFAVTRDKVTDEGDGPWTPDLGIAPLMRLYWHPVHGDLQAWLERVDPHYLSTYPSILKSLDLSRFKSLRDVATTGEQGGNNYSCEEAGTIALECPDNPEVLHVMENIILEIVDGQVLVTDTTSPYLRRYALGDTAEWATCHCGRTLPAIQKVVGRVRNWLHRPDGTRQYPYFGQKKLAAMPIQRYQMRQTAVDHFELHLICPPMDVRGQFALVDLVRREIGYPCTVDLVFQSAFPPGKFEEFKWAGG